MGLQKTTKVLRNKTVGVGTACKWLLKIMSTRGTGNSLFVEAAKIEKLEQAFDGLEILLHLVGNPLLGNNLGSRSRDTKCEELGHLPISIS